ncbi:MAG: WbqC family protein [Thermodesulfobacteriota bacterium]
MVVAVHQPQYMPWLGYFAKLAAADHFVLLDSVQYKKNEWQNRNRIKNGQGWQWLTVPVSYRFPMRIGEVAVDERQNWRTTHLRSIETNYRRAPFFAWLRPFLQSVYERPWATIAELNGFVVREIAGLLGISTRIVAASELGALPDDADERLIAIVRAVGGDVYLAGSGGRGYMDLEKWRRAGIEVRFQEYRHPVYPQLFGAFAANLSIVDLLCNCGPASLDILREHP